MAILTPTRPRGQRTTARRDQASFSATASAWLGHPMADVFLVVVPALLLLGIGTIMVWSASSVFAQVRFGDPYYFLLRQLAFLVIGMGLLAIGWRVPTETLRKLAWPMLILTVIGLLITFLPGVGVDKKGNRNWIAIPGFDMLRLQPSELAKLAVIVWGSAVLVAKQRLLHLKLHLLVPFLPVSLILIGGVVMQKDLGTAMILGMVGKWAIHPSQVELAHDVFSPKAEDVARARDMKKAYDVALSQGLGAVQYEGKMIDIASVRIVNNLIERADLIGM